MDEPKPLGYHILAEFQDCHSSFLIWELRTAANRAGLTILKEGCHRFEPEGVTGFLVLSESHAAAHTWPERKYAAVDIFCCGDGSEPAQKAHKFLRELHNLLGGQYFCRVMTPRGPF